MRPRLYLSPPHVGSLERELLLEAFDSNWIAPLGPHVRLFEQELAERLAVASVAALSSGTAGLQLGLRLAGVGPGDEVVVSTLTFAASAFAVRYLGASPVFIDSEERSANMDPALLAEELEESALRGRLPRAALVVDIYGQTADFDAIGAICDRYGVPVIEDAAEALGATYKGRAAGSLGLMGVLSFNGNKIITTSGGGALVSDQSELVEQAVFLATQAREPAPHYQHTTIGYNFRLSNLLAAVGRGQLRQLDERIARRRAINTYYRQALQGVAGIEFLPEAPWGGSTHWLTCLLVDPAVFGAAREDVRAHLEASNIEARPVWKPMHLQPVFTGCRVRGGKVSERFFDLGLCLPSGSAMRDEDQDRVVEAILETPRRSGR